MTEEEWLTDEKGLTPLLRELVGTGTGMPPTFSCSSRLERLFAIACSRSGLVQDERLHKAIGVVERFADGLASRDEIEQAREAADGMPSGPQRELALANLALSDRSYLGAVLCCAERLELAHLPGDPLRNVDLPAHWKIWRAQAARLRDLFGNPFRPITLTAAHRTSTVVSLARAAYDERRLPCGELDPHRLAVLADALEEVGAAAELVAHLRGLGPHTRGCWGVDLALGLS